MLMYCDRGHEKSWLIAKFNGQFAERELDWLTDPVNGESKCAGDIMHNWSIPADGWRWRKPVLVECVNEFEGKRLGGQGCFEDLLQLSKQPDLGALIVHLGFDVEGL